MNLDTHTEAHPVAAAAHHGDAVIISLAAQRELRARRQVVQRLATRLLQELRIPRFDDALVPWLTQDPAHRSNATALCDWIAQELPHHGYARPDDELRVQRELASRLNALLQILEPATC